MLLINYQGTDPFVFCTYKSYYSLTGNKCMYIMWNTNHNKKPLYLTYDMIVRMFGETFQGRTVHVQVKGLLDARYGIYKL